MIIRKGSFVPPQNTWYFSTSNFIPFEYLSSYFPSTMQMKISTYSAEQSHTKMLTLQQSKAMDVAQMVPSDLRRKVGA
jgi:hypothetical protein